jgi:hypothetical protein
MGSDSFAARRRRIRAAVRSVRTEYEPLWRYAFNAGPVWRCLHSPARLGVEAGHVTEELHRTYTASSARGNRRLRLPEGFAPERARSEPAFDRGGHR